MTDYRLLNTRLLAEIARDVALTPAELDRLATIRRRQRRLRGYLAALARLARDDQASNVIPFRRGGGHGNEQTRHRQSITFGET